MKKLATILVSVAAALSMLLSGNVQRAYAQDLPKVTDVHFQDLDSEKGFVSGSIDFKLPAGSDAKDYVVYFTDAKGTKIKQLGSVNVQAQNEGKEHLRKLGYNFFGASYSYNFPGHDAIPQGADSIGIFGKNTSGESDSGTIFHIWDNPVALLQAEPFVDDNPLRGMKGTLRWNIAPGQPAITGYELTYFNGTDWLPYEVSADLLKPGKNTYEIPFNTDNYPKSGRIITLRVKSLTALDGDAPSIYFDFIDDISGETSGPSVVTNGTPKITTVTFADNDPKPGAIGGSLHVEADDTEFLKAEYSTGGTSLMYGLYFLDSSDKKIKGMMAKPAYRDASGNYYFQIPKGTVIPTGAKSIGVFADLPTAEGAVYAKVDLRDNGGNDHFAQDVRFVDTDPAEGHVKGKVIWKASPHEDELKGYAVFAGDDTEPFATVPKGVSPYSADVPEFYTDASKPLTFKVIPVNADGSYGYSINFNDGYAALTDAFAATDKFDSGRADEFGHSFSDDDPRPGYISGLVPIDGFIAKQGSADIYFYDQQGHRLGKTGSITYKGHDDRHKLYFAVPEGTKVPEQAVYIGRSTKDEDGKTTDTAFYIADNVMEQKPVFQDEKPSELSYMYRLIKSGIMTGFDDGTLRMKEKVTRAQFAALLSRAFKLHDESGASAFKDVRPADWFAGPVAAAVKNGLLQGYEDGTFRPNQTLAKKEMYVILYRIAQARSKKSLDMDPSYVDFIVKQYKGNENFPEWLKPAIAWFSLRSVVYKWEDLQVHEDATRDDVATALGRFVE